MTTFTMTYKEFKTKRIEWQKTTPPYLQDLESCFESSTQQAYKMALNGRVPAYAQL